MCKVSVQSVDLLAIAIDMMENTVMPHDNCIEEKMINNLVG